MRNSGPVFLGWGIALAVAGLILALAVKDKISNVDLSMIGWILAAAGGVCALVGIAMSMSGGRTRTTSITQRTPEGQVHERTTDF